MSRIRRNASALSGCLLLTLSLLAVVGFVPEAAAAPADHLIISEVVTKTRVIGAARLGSEYIEIVNPTASGIDMGNVYLTDGTFSTNATYYWQIAAGVRNAATIGGGGFNDFHVRFPTGYVLAAGDTLAIAVNGSAQYAQAYGRQPDFELYEDASTPDLVPEMVPVFPGSVHTGDPTGEASTALLPTLSDASESLILYRWDGTSNLVADLDFMFWGSGSGVLFDKSGVVVGTSTYLNDTPIGSQVPVSLSQHNFGESYARFSADEGTEVLTGGNGITGHNETSENLGANWRIAPALEQSPPQAPAVLFATAPIFEAGGFSPLAPYAGQEVVLTVNVVSNSALAGVDFKVAVNGAAPLNIAGVLQTGSTWTATVPVQVAGAVIAWYAVANNAAGRSATWPVAAPLFTRGWTVAEAPDPGDFPAKLLLTEVATIGTDQEFVEIYNPGTAAVDLSNYYLTDAIHSTSGQYYWRIAEGNPAQTTVGGGAFADFHSRFPAGFSIGAGDTIVVSLAGTALYSASFGFLPDLELWEDDAFPDNVPDMRWVYGDEIDNSIINRTGASPSTPTLTNGGEVVILYHWDGVSDKVTDIDIFHWKDPSSTTTSFFFSKTGVTVGSHSYLPDTATGSQSPFPQAAEFGFSYQRIDASEGTQTPTGSNGVLGRDETSENMGTTFELAVYDPSRPSTGSTGGAAAKAQLLVEAKTFMPSQGETFPIRFVTKPRSETKLRLYDMEGRIVVTLFDSRFNGSPSTLPDAPSTVVWNGLDNTYQRVRAGMYIAHLSVVDDVTGEQETVTAPVVVATRLSK